MEAGKMDFYTVVLRQNVGYWVALCLENGLVGQGNSKEDAVAKLKESIESFDEVYKTENDIYNAPISIKELHEFLTIEGEEPTKEKYEMMAVHA